MVNKHLAKYLKSNDAALLVSHFLSLQEEIFGGKPFYQQQSRIMDELNIKLPTLRKLVNLLEAKNLLTYEKVGMPAKHHYYINTQELHKVISLDLPKSEPQEITESISQRKELIKENLVKENKEKDNRFKVKVDMNYFEECIGTI
jgi:hypothetical protein